MTATEETVKLLGKWYQHHREQREQARKRRREKQKRRKYKRKLKKTRRRLVLQAIALAVFAPLFLERTGHIQLAATVHGINHWFIVAAIVVRKPLSKRLVEKPDIDLEEV